MDNSKIPVDFHWLIPLVEKLNREFFELNENLVLSSSERELFESRFSKEVRKNLENWIDEGSQESGEFLTAMVLLNDLGLLESTEPVLNYAFWFSELDSKNWGNRAGAAKVIGKKWLESLSKTDLELLRKRLRSANAEQNPNTIIWFSWLLCKMGDCWDENVQKISNFLVDAEVGTNLYDEVTDACYALLSLNRLPEAIMEKIEEIILMNSLPELDRASILDTLFQSDHVPQERKLNVFDRVSELTQYVDDDEIKSVLAEFKT